MSGPGPARVGLLVGLEHGQHRLELGRARVLGADRFRKRLVVRAQRKRLGVDLALRGLHAREPVGGRVEPSIVLFELGLDLLALVHGSFDGQRGRGDPRRRRRRAIRGRGRAVAGLVEGRDRDL